MASGRRDGTQLETRVGAVAMIDALGFRGIWSRYPDEDVVEKLRSLAEVAASEARALQEGARSHGGNLLEFVQPMALSDTVVLGVATKPLDAVARGLQAEGWGEIIKFDDATLAGEAVRLCAELLGALVRRALEEPVPLAYRGAIAFGRFGMADRFIVGPAIDEAAEWMERPEGAIVMLAPSAAQYPQAQVPSAASNLFHTEVPMSPKRCQAPMVQTWALAPFAGIHDPLRRQLHENCVASFGQSPTGSIAQKLANTQAFLAAADLAESSLLRSLLEQARRP